MEEFAALLDSLVYTRSRNAKLKLLADYLRDTPDPDRGWALAALTDGLDFPAVKSSTIRNLLSERVDPILYALSRDFVGDSAETASLLWPEPEAAPSPPSVAEAVAALAHMTRASVMSELPRLLDRLDSDGRYALLKMATGAMRIGISARLAKTAFAQAFGVGVEEVEEHWHGQTPPYTALFAWAAHGEEAPSSEGIPLFRPFMLAHPTRRSSTWPTTPRSGNGTAFACSSCAPGTKPASTRARATTSRARSPKSPPRCRSRLSSMASCWSEEAIRAARKAVRPVSTPCSSGSGARSSARRCWRNTPRSYAFTTR
jgi:hypothetical protein